MKKVMTAVLLTLSIAFGAVADEPYFVTKKGTKLLYAKMDGNGKITGYTRYNITNVTGSGGNMTVTQTTQELDANKKVVMESPPIDVKIVNGAVEVDVTGSMRDVLASMTDVDAKVGGDPKITLPAKIAKGDKLRDVNITVTMNVEGMQMNMGISQTNNQCVAIEKVTVPAGTFDAVKMTQDVNMTMNGQSMSSTKGHVWYARGIGLVKTESKTTAMGGVVVNTSMVLQAIEK